jgi:predicted protein tyrosine phosphatase
MSSIPEFIITSERGATTLLDADDGGDIRHVVSIVDPTNNWRLRKGKPTVLVLLFHDEEDPPRSTVVACSEKQIAGLLGYAAAITRGKVLIHCWAGCRRSGAAGFIFACLKLGEGCEEEAAKIADRSARLAMNRNHEFVPSKINPNRRMVRIADELMGRGGKMIAACEAAWPRKKQT